MKAPVLAHARSRHRQRQHIAASATSQIEHERRLHDRLRVRPLPPVLIADDTSRCANGAHLRRLA